MFYDYSIDHFWFGQCFWWLLNMLFWWISAVTCFICVSTGCIRLPCIFKCNVANLVCWRTDSSSSRWFKNNSSYLQRCLPNPLPEAVVFRLVYGKIEDSEQNKGIIPELCLKWPLTAFVLLIKIFIQPLQFLLRWLVTAVEVQDYTSYWWQKCEALPVLILYLLSYIVEDSALTSHFLYSFPAFV